MAKPTISIPDGMLEDVDRRAAESGVSRSAFIQEAIARYGEALDTEHERDQRADRIRAAIEKMRVVAASMPPGAVDAETAIRAVRDAPPRWTIDPDDR